MVRMNAITTDKRCAVVRALVEGCSIRSTVRMTGVSKNAIARLIVSLGCKCAEYQYATLRNLTCRRIQVDEIWSFVGCKEKNVVTAENGGIGDVWTWVAIDADSKLVPSWLVGDRDGYTAKLFINDLESRLSHRVQLTSDGHRPYLEAVGSTFGANVDYAMLVKMYGSPTGEEQRRYSPANRVGCERHIVMGKPDPEHISTSFVERQNLTMRMGMRRFTRLTNAFSKKLENHCHSIAIHYMHYNFARVHQSLRCSPAMRAGVTNRLWKIEDIVALLEE